jgi:hypothetical protein
MVFGGGGQGPTAHLQSSPNPRPQPLKFWPGQSEPLALTAPAIVYQLILA